MQFHLFAVSLSLVVVVGTMLEIVVDIVVERGEFAANAVVEEGFGFASLSSVEVGAANVVAECVEAFDVVVVGWVVCVDEVQAYVDEDVLPFVVAHAAVVLELEIVLESGWEESLESAGVVVATAAAAHGGADECAAAAAVAEEYAGETAVVAPVRIAVAGSRCRSADHIVVEWDR